MVAGTAESTCSGRFVTPWRSAIRRRSVADSSISGRPAFTSSTWAPASVWLMASCIT